MPTSTPLFEGQNLISGILETGQNVFASFKPVLILFLGLLFGFFVIYIIIIFLRNILQNRISDEQDRRVIAYDIIDKTINTKYKKEVEGLLKNFENNPAEIGEKIKAISTKYTNIKKDIYKKMK